jgi:two-component system, cell cycle response regulator CtrA
MLSDDPWVLQGLIERYKTRIDTLEEELADLKERLRGVEKDEDFALAILFRLTAKEFIILRHLMERESSTREYLFSSLYQMRTDDELPMIKIVDVFVCKLRKKLAKHGIKIETVWGKCFLITSTMKDNLRAVVSDLRNQGVGVS